MEQDITFHNRAESYLSALSSYPDVLAKEFSCALLTIPSGCEKVEKFIPCDLNIKHIAFETNKDWSELTNINYCSFDRIPCEDQSVNTILSLASLHHCNAEERIQFYKEAKRLLKPGGKLVMGDVLLDSNQDKWLNIFVNKYNPFGHNGEFWTAEEAKLLQSVGFSVTYSIQEYSWDFPDNKSMYDFCRKLFFINSASDEELYDGLTKYLNANFDSHSIPWKLIYFTAALIP
jgi:SAM-dependent methyltransferase